MPLPHSRFTAQDVARHYDDLSDLYLRLWGEHLHHGLWEAGAQATAAQAAEVLLARAVAPLDLKQGDRVIDIGCGFGADARWIANTFNAHVSGITVSRRQFEMARANDARFGGMPVPVVTRHSPRFARQVPAPRAARDHHDRDDRATQSAARAQSPRPSADVEFLLGDWLANDLANSSFDAAIAIESLDHFADKPAFFESLARVLKPGGRAAIVCWSAAPDLQIFERLALSQLAREGRLANFETFESYQILAENAGLVVMGHRDWTDQAAQTWRVIGRRARSAFRSSQGFRRQALSLLMTRPGLAIAVSLMRCVYHLRALRYGALWLRKES